MVAPASPPVIYGDPNGARIGDYTANLAGLSDDDLNALIGRLSSGAMTDNGYFASLGQSNQSPGSNQWGVGNMFQDPIKGSNSGEGLRQASVLNQLHWGGLLGGHNKKARAKERAWEAARKEAYQTYLKQHGAMLDEAKQELGKRGQIKNVNANFAAMDPLYAQIENQQRTAGISQLQTQYQELLRQSSLAKAAQGLQGSSVDAESRGDLQAGLNADSIGAAQGAHNYAMGLRGQNEQQREQMVDQLSHGNPYSGSTYEAQLRQIANQTAAGNQQTQFQLQGNELSQYGQNLQSQALGNAMTNLGQLYRTNTMNNAYSSYSPGSGYGDPTT